MLHASGFTLHDSCGYAAMFSFLVLTTVLATLVAVFTALVSRNIFIARTGIADLENTYAAEGFIEDTIRRAKSVTWADTANGETLTIANSLVTATLASEGSFKNYYFSARLNNKYFKNEVLKLEGSGSTAKIKEWRDSP